MVRQNGEDSSKRESRGRAKYLFEAMAGACILTQDGHTVRKHFRTGKASRQVSANALPGMLLEAVRRILAVFFTGTFMTELGQHRIFPDFKRQRARMVKLLEEQGITDEAVLAAMRTVRRHLFVPEALQGRAYEDHALPIGFGQTISQPYIVAFMSQLLEAKPGMKVLEIGTGSGYQAAVLREMGLEVFTIERVRELYEAARSFSRKEARGSA